MNGNISYIFGEEMITKKVLIYNLVAVAEGFMLIGISVLLWFFTYHFSYDMTAVLTDFFFKQVPDNTSSMVATIVVIILAVEATVRGAKSYGRNSYKDSWYQVDLADVSTSAYVLNRDIKSNLTFIYIISQIIMAAPRLLVHGVICLNKVLAMSRTEIRQGEIIMRNLSDGEAWQAFSGFEHLERVVHKLVTLKLVLMRERNDQLELRLSRDIRE